MADKSEGNYEFISKDEHENKHKSIGELTVDLDCSDAITGLKSVQREAKKATAALKEFDDTIKHQCPKCKRISLDIQTLYAGEGAVDEFKQCDECGWGNHD